MVSSPGATAAKVPPVSSVVIVSRASPWRGESGSAIDEVVVADVVPLPSVVDEVVEPSVAVVGVVVVDPLASGVAVTKGFWVIRNHTSSEPATKVATQYGRLARENAEGGGP